MPTLPVQDIYRTGQNGLKLMYAHTQTHTDTHTHKHTHTYTHEHAHTHGCDCMIKFYLPKFLYALYKHVILAYPRDYTGCIQNSEGKGGCFRNDQRAFRTNLNQCLVTLLTLADTPHENPWSQPAAQCVCVCLFVSMSLCMCVCLCVLCAGLS